MAEVKPWMRRAAEGLIGRMRTLYVGNEPAKREIRVQVIANEIAAHAPPVEKMVEALRNQGLTTHFRWQVALGIYDSWLAKQDTEK